MTRYLLRATALAAALFASAFQMNARAQLAPLAPPPITVAPPVPTPVPPPPLAQVYALCVPGVRLSNGETMVPLNFFSDQLGASTGKLRDASGEFYRATYFGRTVDVYPYQFAARFNGQSRALAAMPQAFSNRLYVPLAPLAEFWNVKWRVTDGNTGNAPQSTILLQYSAARVKSLRTTRDASKMRVVLELTGPTRVTASQVGREARFRFAGARDETVPGALSMRDVLVSRVALSSGNWNATLKVPLNYRAPIRWFTLGSPSRLVIDAQRNFEEKSASPLDERLQLTSIRKGTPDGPVQMWVARFAPQDGWRLKVAPAGWGIGERARPSRVASRFGAPLAVNGGFFAYDGGAVGAVMVDGEWLRLPWKGRTAVAFRPDGRGKIGNLQARARVVFNDTHSVPVRDLNAWPQPGTMTVITPRFGRYARLRPGQIGVEVENGRVISKPGGGGVNVRPNGFTLVAGGGAKPWLDAVTRGMTARLEIEAIGWDGFTTALGGGPRLVQNGRVNVTATRENFRSDVRVGRGPRTALGIDRYGRYILLVVDGRRPGYSIGMTLYELAATMRKLGAVDALNFDGGGSTAMVSRSRVINRPSDGSERRVSNVLLVTR